jgi:hypothetical protein
MKFVNHGMKVAISLSVVVALGLSFYIGYDIASSKYKSMIGDKALARFMTEFSTLKYLEKGNDVEDNAKMLLLMTLEVNIVDLCDYEPSVVDDIYRKQQKKLFLNFSELRKTYPPINYGDGGIFNHRVELCLKQISN